LLLAACMQVVSSARARRAQPLSSRAIDFSDGTFVVHVQLGGHAYRLSYRCPMWARLHGGGFEGSCLWVPARGWTLPRPCR
jgi:hypothetical protein